MSTDPRNEAERFLDVAPECAAGLPPQRVRYPALSVVAAGYRLLAMLSFMAGVVVVVLGIRGLELSEGAVGKIPAVMLIVGGVLGGMVGMITSLAASEGIRIFIDIEDHARAVREHLVREDVEDADDEESNDSPDDDDGVVKVTPPAGF